MPILDHWDLQIDAGAVLRGQGAEPDLIQARRPRLYELALQALDEGLPLVQPQVLYERFAVREIRHTRLRLEDGELKGDLLAKHLGGSREVLAAVCTIGPALEERVDRVMATDMVRGLALYGLGSAAVEALANAACRRFELEAATRGWQTTIPLSPGMIGWSVEEGQPQIFSLLDTRPIGVHLTRSAIMQPTKSLSMVLGLGPDLNRQGSPCDYCAMQAVCKYQTHYAQFA